MSTDDDRLNALAETYLQLMRDGRAPTVADFAARYPDEREELEELLPLIVALDAPDPVPAASDPAGLTLPYRLGEEFTLTRLLGRGGMGSVFEATQESLGRRCAVKLLSANMARHDDLRKRFTRESQILARLRHPNIITIHGAGEADGFSYYAMDLVEGPSLTSLCKTPDDIARIGIQVAGALDYAHGYGIFHCDIKPSNLLPDTDGNIHVADFGLARLRAVSEKESGGTRRYMAPERLMYGTVSGRTDQYALGLTLHELLDGAFPVTADTQTALEKKLAEEPLPPPKKGPPELAAILRKMTARDPDNRYNSLYHAAEDLRRFLNRRPISAYNAPPLYRLRLSFRRAPVRSSFLSLLAVGLLVLPIVLGIRLFHTERQLQNESERLGLARTALRDTLGHVAQIGATQSNARLVGILARHFPKLLACGLIPEAGRQEICKIFGTVALIDGRLNIAEPAYACLFSEHPSARIGNQYADVLYRMGRPGLGNSISRRIISHYGRLTDPESRCEVITARLRLPETERGAPEQALRQLLAEAPNHSAVLQLCARLRETHPDVLRRAWTDGPLPSATDLYKLLLREHPDQPEYNTALLNYAARRLTGVTPAESESLYADIEFTAVEAIFLRRNQSNDFAAQAAVSNYLQGLGQWIRRTTPRLGASAPYRRCISSLPILFFLADFPKDVTRSITTAYIRISNLPSYRSGEQSLHEAINLSNRIGLPPYPSSSGEIFDELKNNPDWSDLRTPGIDFNEPLFDRRRRLMRTSSDGSPLKRRHTVKQESASDGSPLKRGHSVKQEP